MNDTELQLLLLALCLAIFPVLWVLDYLRARLPKEQLEPPRYLVPLGWRGWGPWRRRHWVDVERTPCLVLPDATHLSLVIGTLAVSGADVAVLDGSGLRCQPWQGKVWQMALDTAQIASVTTAITRERERRIRAMRAGDGVQPLLVVVVGSLTVLQGVLGHDRARRWLAVEVTAGQAVGLRFVVVADALPLALTRVLEA